MKDKYVKVIIPVLVTYIKWFDEIEELDTILSSLDTEEEEDEETPIPSSKNFKHFIFSLWSEQ